MSNVMTARELAQRYADPDCTGPTIGIEADVPLDGGKLAVLENLLVEDKALAGLEVLAPDGTSLGVVPLADVLEYVLEQPSDMTRGGHIRQLEGVPVSNAPLFRCDAHEPAEQRLLWAASSQLLTCQVCGRRMQRVKS